jgi:hypothetical protein
LGTATFDSGADRPANSLVFIHKGRVVAQKNKAFSFFSVEKEVFTMRPASNRHTIHPRVAALVCSDILGETSDPALYQGSLLMVGSDNQNPRQSVPFHAETALFSSCWAIPLTEDPRIDALMSREDRFRSQLEGRIRRLFHARPFLKEVIVADRLAPISGVSAPYNGHFRRVNQAASS